MSHYLAEQLNLANLPPFKLLEADYEAELDALRSGIVAKFAEKGITYDVGNLETDPVMILAQEFAYRKLLTVGQINDAGKQMSLQFSYGPALDHLAATQFADLDIARLVVGQDADGNAIMEEDGRFRDRIALAPQVRSPGTLGSYEFWAMTAAPDVVSVRALNYASGLVSPGQIRVVVYGGEDEAANVEKIREVVTDRRVKLGTDDVSVAAAIPVPVDISAVLDIKRGPDPAIVVAEAQASLDVYRESIQVIGEMMARSGIIASVNVGGVVRATVSSPESDVIPPPDGVVVINSTTITTNIL